VAANTKADQTAAVNSTAN